MSTGLNLGTPTADFVAKPPGSHTYHSTKIAGFLEQAIAQCHATASHPQGTPQGLFRGRFAEECF